jgi:hypothetical protein
MDVQAFFGLSILMSFVAFGLVTRPLHLASASSSAARRRAPPPRGTSHISVRGTQVWGGVCLALGSVFGALYPRERWERVRLTPACSGCR